ncbi:hypothetical protein [Halodurantibacterium flavum]|uniref:Uncharacterized protein n=1 Tax=Halodurantibacterium flavum TaxID=1382802 RepID=A0ABW4SBG0_9RHOB
MGRAPKSKDTEAVKDAAAPTEGATAKTAQQPDVAGPAAAGGQETSPGPDPRPAPKPDPDLGSGDAPAAPGRRLFTATTTILHDGELVLAGTSVGLTAEEHGALRTARAVEGDWDDAEPLPE